jgi:hypothetical protein
LGDIVVSDVGPTLLSTLRQAIARARHAVRRRLHKRLSKFRRIKRGHGLQWPTDTTSRRRHSLGNGSNSTRNRGGQKPQVPRFPTFHLPSDRFKGCQDQGESH